MKRRLSATPPESLIAYEIEPGKVLFVHRIRSANRVPDVAAALA